MADPKYPRIFSEEFKRQIVQPYDNGKAVSEIGAEYDLGHSTVHRWIKSIHESGSTRAADNRAPDQQRILELEKENERPRMEVDVIKRQRCRDVPTLETRAHNPEGSSDDAKHQQYSPVDCFERERVSFSEPLDRRFEFGPRGQT